MLAPVSVNTRQIRYELRHLGKTYSSDLICYSKMIVELKSVSALTGEHRDSVHGDQRPPRSARELRLHW